MARQQVSSNQLKLEKPATWLVCFLIILFPLLFGAVHPIVLGAYTFMILVGLGGWLLLNSSQDASLSLSFWWLVPLILIGYLVFQTIPLPLDLVELLSPNRAARIHKVNELTGTNLHWVPLSENGISSLYRSFFLFSLFIYFVALKRLISNNAKAFVLIYWLIIGLGTFEALYGLMQFVKPNLGILWLKLTAGRAAHGTIIYKNQYASLLNMIWPLAIAGFTIYSITDNHPTHRKKLDFAHRVSKNKTQSTLLFTASGLMTLAVLFSLSRGGILSMLLVALLLLILFPIKIKKKLTFLAIFGVIIVSYGAILGIDTISSRFSTIGATEETRIAIYLSSLPMLYDHVLVGIGLGSYTQMSPIYLVEFPLGVHFDRAHNEYLEILIELGVPMASLLFLWIIGGVTRILKIIKSAHLYQTLSKPNIILAISAVSALIGFLIHGFVDFGWRLPANLFYATTLLAMLVPCLSEDKVSGETEP